MLFWIPNIQKFLQKKLCNVKRKEWSNNHTVPAAQGPCRDRNRTIRAAQADIMSIHHRIKNDAIQFLFITLSPPGRANVYPHRLDSRTAWVHCYSIESLLPGMCIQHIRLSSLVISACLSVCIQVQIEFPYSPGFAISQAEKEQNRLIWLSHITVIQIP